MENDSKYSVYVFKSSKEAILELNNNEYSFKKEDIYYVGKGNESRIKNMDRNVECNYLTRMLSGYVEILQSSLTEEEALSLEEFYIDKFNSEFYLSNKTLGNKMYLRKDVIPEIKYLIELDSMGIININLSSLSEETRTSKSSIMKIQDLAEYISCVPRPPSNIKQILNKYKPKEDNKVVLFGELKYCFDLIDKGILRMSMKDLYTYYNLSHAIVKEAKESNIIPIRPNENILNDLFNSYGFHIITEKELRDGKVLSCLILKDKHNLNITDIEIAEILSINSSRVADVKRSDNEGLKPVELSNEEIGMLFSKNKDYLITETYIKNKKFEWYSPEVY